MGDNSVIVPKSGQNKTGVGEIVETSKSQR